jgi:signal recognition particle subunit SEC65
VVALGNEEVSLEEMWKVVENYGINRKIMEMSHPRLDELKAVYSMIKKRNALIIQKA